MGSSATRRRTSTTPQKLQAFFAVVQALNAQGKLLAYHDRSDGGLFATLCEMMFAGHVGVTVEIDSSDAVGRARSPALFNEELGAVLQVRRERFAEVEAAFEAAGLGARMHADRRAESRGPL